MKIIYLITAISWAQVASSSLDQTENISNLLNFYERISKNQKRNVRFTSNYYTNRDDFGDAAAGKNETFDFIVIGSGPSGAVIANRLSEVPRWKVLLIEAGEEPSVITDIPFLSGTLQFTNYDWGYRAEKEEGYCKGCLEGSLKWPHGKVLGGSTNINYMIQVRGNRLDYDRWAAMGNPGWSYKDVLPYFLKSEDARIEKQDTEYHRQGGYLSVSDVPVRTESVHAFVKAAQEAGLKYVDYNGRNQLGVSYAQATLRNGKRCSAEKAFLRPVRDRKNLKILTRARAVQILINPDTKEAYGVKYARNKKYHTAIARKEVVLCAGGLNSPQLLMLSGIGPKEHLEELGIPVLQDLPVGQKMYDHATFSGILIRVNDSKIIFNQQSAITDPNNFVKFLVNGTGVFSSIGGVEALAYIKTSASTDPDPSYPDMELIYVGGGIQIDFGLVYRRIFNIPQEMYDFLWKPFENKGLIQIFPMLVHPKSYGYIRLKSKNPFHWPKFYANFFSDPENHDVKTFIAAVREIERIIQSPSMQKYEAALVKIPVPGIPRGIASGATNLNQENLYKEDQKQQMWKNVYSTNTKFVKKEDYFTCRQTGSDGVGGCEQHVFGTDDYWECAVRTITGTFYHQVATCKMGPADDPEAVVNAKLQVYGIKNLRVADTSIIPLPVTAHTMEPAYMVGEKASDLIKEHWGKKRQSSETKN